MATKTVRIGSLTNITQYDDGDFTEAADFDGQPIKIGPSSAADEAVRQDEIPTIGNIVSASANISDNAIVRGDGGAKGIQSSKISINDNGILLFESGAGLPIAEIYAYDVADTIAIAASGKANKVQVTSFDTNGLSKTGLTPDHTNDHITIGVACYCLCTVSLVLETTGAGAAIQVGASVYKNNGATELQNVHAHRRLTGGGTDAGSLSLSGVIDCAAADTIELWIWNETNTDDIVVDDVTLTLIMVGRG